jgi:predicted small lipoprotein YifL
MSRQIMMVLMLALAVAGCGRRGLLEPPPSASAQAAQPADDKSVTGSADMALAPSKSHKPPPIQPGNGSFILDPLL